MIIDDRSRKYEINLIEIDKLKKQDMTGGGFLKARIVVMKFYVLLCQEPFCFLLGLCLRLVLFGNAMILHGIGDWVLVFWLRMAFLRLPLLLNCFGCVSNFFVDEFIGFFI